VAVGDDARVRVDPAPLEQLPDAALGGVDLVELDVDGARDVALARIAGIASGARVLLRCADVEQRDPAALKQLRELVAAQDITSRTKPRRASVTASGRSSGVR
jgi:hypothetical protein